MVITNMLVAQRKEEAGNVIGLADANRELYGMDAVGATRNELSNDDSFCLCF